MGNDSNKALIWIVYLGSYFVCFIASIFLFENSTIIENALGCLLLGLPMGGVLHIAVGVALDPEQNFSVAKRVFVFFLVVGGLGLLVLFAGNPEDY